MNGSRTLRRLKIDPFVASMLATITLAAAFPAAADVATILDHVVTGAIAVLFFLYGLRLEPREAFEGLRNWRLHALIFGFTFALFPLIGMALRVLEPHVLGHALYAGVLFLTLVPSTIQSSVSFTSIARGNVAGAVVSASASNLIGIALTPALVAAMIALGFLSGASGARIGADSALTISLQILLPFVIGQLVRPITHRWTAGPGNRLKSVDRGVILLVIYSAFSDGMRQHIWRTVRPWQIAVLVMLAAVLVAALLWLTGRIGTWLRLPPGDVIAIQFCGTKKSLATGLPMASVIFAGQQVGLIVLPLMIFHQVQLMMCSWLAARYARSSTTTDTVPAAPRSMPQPLTPPGPADPQTTSRRFAADTGDEHSTPEHALHPHPGDQA